MAIRQLGHWPRPLCLPAPPGAASWGQCLQHVGRRPPAPRTPPTLPIAAHLLATGNVGCGASACAGPRPRPRHPCHCRARVVRCARSQRAACGDRGATPAANAAPPHPAVSRALALQCSPTMLLISRPTHGASHNHAPYPVAARAPLQQQHAYTRQPLPSALPKGCHPLRLYPCLMAAAPLASACSWPPVHTHTYCCQCVHLQDLPAANVAAIVESYVVNMGPTTQHSCSLPPLHGCMHQQPHATSQVLRNRIARAMAAAAP